MLCVFRAADSTRMSDQHVEPAASAAQGADATPPAAVRPNPFGEKAVFRSVLLVTGSTYVNYAVGLIVSTAIARSLGPSDFGRYSYLVWLAGILVIFSTNGLTASGMRFVSECVGRGDVGGARDVNGWLLRRHYISLALVAVGFAIATPYLEPAGWQGQLWTFAFLAFFSAAAKADFLFRSSIAKGYGIFSVEAATTNILALASLAGVLVLAAMRQPLYAYLCLYGAVSICHPVLTRIFVRRLHIEPTFGPLEPALAAKINNHFGWTIGLTVVAALSNKTIETFLLNRWSGSEAVGFFVIAGTLTRGGIDLLSSGLNSVLLPMMAHAFGGGGLAQANAILANSVRYFLFLGLLLAGTVVLWATPIVELMYGTAYDPAIMALRVMIVVGGITIVDGAFGAMLSTTDNQSVRVKAGVLYVVITAIAALALIPHYGLLGAVAAHAISRITGCLAVGTVLVRTLKVELPYAEILRLFIAAAIGLAAAALVLLLDGGPIGQIGAGVAYSVAYLGSTIPLRLWREQDIRIVSLIAARLPVIRGIAARLQRPR